jgi:pilus assembly protein CpaB
MDTRRLFIALVVALLISATATFYVSRKIQSRNAQPVMQRYVAASRAIQSGEALKPENMSIIEWPSTLPVHGAFTKIEDLTGRSVIYPLASGQPIIDTYLAAAGSGIGLTVKIPEGMRAASVRSDEVVGVAGFLFPGSHVDVLVTLRSDRYPTPATQIVLQDVEVLTAGQNIEPDPQGKPQTVNVVTLLLTPQDSQKLVLATTQGTIHFVLRNGADRGQIKAFPMQASALSGPEAPPPPRSATPGVRAPSPPSRPAASKQAYTVDTISGNKQSSSTF